MNSLAKLDNKTNQAVEYHAGCSWSSTLDVNIIDRMNASIVNYQRQSQIQSSRVK